MRIAVIFIAMLLASSVARAECVKDAKATPEDTCVLVNRGDVRGMWFELQTANALRQDKLEVGQLRLQVDVLQHQAAIREFQLEHYKQALDVQTRALQSAKTGYEQAVKMAMIEEQNARSLQRELDAWYREPSLWAAVGAAAVGALVVALR